MRDDMTGDKGRMSHRSKGRVALGAILFVVLIADGAAAQQREKISFESLQKGKPVQVTAEIYWPAKPGPVPAMVIHHGSGGVGPREARYAHEMATMGVAGVVIDSFAPRGVTSTVQDQFSVTVQDFTLDALRTLITLGSNNRIIRTKIGIVGVSKGGISTLMAAHERLVIAAGVPLGLRYALHVPFYPACVTQFYSPQTTGAPIYMMLGGADSYVGVEPCTTYAEKLRAAGAHIEVKIYPNAGHAFDAIGPPWSDPKGENTSQCVFQQQADGSWIERKSGVKISSAEAKEAPSLAAPARMAYKICQTLGVSGGPNDAARAQSMEDLKSYVRRHLLEG